MARSTDSVGGSPSEEALLRELAAAPAARPVALDVTAEGALRGSDRFSIQRCLGRGGFGTVYEAYDRERSASVALKVLHRAEPRALYLFKQEFRAARELHHPGLVQLYELFADGDRWYFTMELIRGRSLVEHLRAGGPPGVRETCDAMLALFDALGALHAAGLVHRDIKPANVMATPTGRVVLLDFGLVRPVSADSASDVAGTPDYMAPEQAAGRSLTPRSDLYAAGALLFEVLTGAPPFTGAIGVVMARKQQEDGPAPSERTAGIAAELDGLCRELLRRRPEERPGLGAVVARLSHLRGEHAGEHASPRVALAAPTAPLVGRADQLAALRTAFRATDDGRAVVVLCAGDSGVGKGTLCRTFLRELMRDQPGVVVLDGRCFEHEQIPFKAVDGVVDALSRHLARLPAAEAAALLPRDAFALRRIFSVLDQVPAFRDAPDRRLAGPQHLQRAAFGALRELLQRLADRQRVVVFVDDLHWSDDDSRDLWVEVLRPPDPPPLLLCATCRDDAEGPVPAALRALGADGALVVHDLAVRELSAEASLALARSLLPGVPEAVASQVAQESRGNPFHLHELAAHAGPDGVPTIEQAITRQVARLPERARLLLELLCVAGQPVERVAARAALDAVAEGSDPPEAAEVHALAGLRAQRLVRADAGPAGERLVPYHDRVRDSVVAGLTAQTVRAHHLALAHALERGTRAPAEQPERLAMHYAGGGEPGLAARYSIAAADKAHAALAFTRAAGFYEAALASGSLDDDERRTLRRRLGDACAAAGRLRDAARAYRAAAAVAQGTEARDLTRLAMEQLVLGRDLTEGMALATHCLADAGIRLPARRWTTMVSLLIARVRLGLRGFGVRARAEREVPAALLARIDITAPVATTLGVLDPLRGAYLFTLHLLDALRAGELNRLANALGIEAYLRAVRGHHAGAAELIARAKALCARGVTAEVDALTEMGAAGIVLEAGEFRAARDRLRAVGDRLRDQFPGKQWAADMARIGELHALWMLGELRTLEALLPEVVRDAHERGSLLLTSIARFADGCVALCHDRPQAVVDALRELRDRPREAPLRDHALALELAFFAALAAGRRAEAVALVADHAADLTHLRRGHGQHQRVLVARLRATAALAAHDLNGAPAHLRAAEREARRLDREGVPYARATALLVRGLVRKRRGTVMAAQAALADAEARFTESDCALYAACARMRLGELRSGAAGRALVADAERWMASQGIGDPARVCAMLAP